MTFHCITIQYTTTTIIASQYTFTIDCITPHYIRLPLNKSKPLFHQRIPPTNTLYHIASHFPLRVPLHQAARPLQLTLPHNALYQITLLQITLHHNAVHCLAACRNASPVRTIAHDGIPHNALCCIATQYTTLHYTKPQHIA